MDDPAAIEAHSAEGTYRRRHIQQEAHTEEGGVYFLLHNRMDDPTAIEKRGDYEHTKRRKEY
jgi:hypothetical protein